jgi:hypothetical protein
LAQPAFQQIDRVIPPVGARSSSIFEDGFGTRWLAFDPETDEPVEYLLFAPRLVEAPGFAESLGERVARLARNRHTSYARVRRLDRPSADSLVLVADRVAGWRLTDVLRTIEREGLRLDVSAIIGLMRQLIPAAALFSRQQREAANGAIGPERLILTPQGRVVIADYVMATAIEKLQLSRERLWRELRVPLPQSAPPGKVPPSADVVGMGVVALSLVMGRPLKEDEYLVALPDLLELAAEYSGGSSRPLSQGLRDWLGRALQLDEKTALQSPQDAQVAFEEMLAKERGYVTTPALLESFIAKLQGIVGAPPEAERPAAPERVAAPSRPEPVPPPPPAPPPPAPPLMATPVVRPVQLAPVIDPPAVPSSSYSTDWMPPRPVAEVEPEPVVEVAPPAPVPVPAAAYGLSSYGEPELPVSAYGQYSGPTSIDADEPATPVASESRSESGIRSRSSSRTRVAASAASASEPAVATSSVEARGSAPGWMKLALAALAMIAILEAAALGWIMTQGAAPGLTGTNGELVVQSRPAAARVTVDGEEKGITPYNMELAPGPHILEIRVGRSEPRVIPINIRAGVQSGVYVELQSVATVGGLDVRSDPGKARVSVDGQFRGTTPLVLKDLPPGNHEVVLESGSNKVRQTVRIEPGVTSQLVVPLGSR